jgi:hypothetical protein
MTSTNSTVMRSSRSHGAGRFRGDHHGGNDADAFRASEKSEHVGEAV